MTFIIGTVTIFGGAAAVVFIVVGLLKLWDNGTLQLLFAVVCFLAFTSFVLWWFYGAATTVGERVITLL